MPRARVSLLTILTSLGLLTLAGCDPKPKQQPATTAGATAAQTNATTQAKPATTAGAAPGAATTYTAALRAISEDKGPVKTLTLTITPQDATTVKVAINGGEAVSVALKPTLHYEAAKEPAGVRWLSADINAKLGDRTAPVHLELRQADGALSGYWELGGEFMKTQPDDPETRRPVIFGLLHATPGEAAPTIPADDKLHCAVRCTVFERCGGQGPEQCNSSNTCFGECYDVKK